MTAQEWNTDLQSQDDGVTFCNDAECEDITLDASGTRTLLGAGGTADVTVLLTVDLVEIWDPTLQTLVSTAGMVSTTYVQFLKGSLLVVFSAVLAVLILQRGFEAVPDEAAVKAIETLRDRDITVRSLQEFHENEAAAAGT